MTVLIKGARPYGEDAVDLLLEDGRIAAIGDSLTVPGADVVEAAGQLGPADEVGRGGGGSGRPVVDRGGRWTRWRHVWSFPDRSM